ncbi:hypothetical protein ABZV78_28125 [Micromonospora sp. NPDC004540]|uniref:hypothetical protein n=1 Tax=Micromonospora sp. NPDC004540 TaxID=3154457 RepID=UPI0033A197DB
MAEVIAGLHHQHCSMPLAAQAPASAGRLSTTPAAAGRAAKSEAGQVLCWHVTQHLVEAGGQSLVDRVDDAYHEPMIEQSQRRVPMPVVAASVILLVAAVLPASMMFASGPSMVTGLIGVLLLLALAYGLWRGSGRARFWTTVFSTASVVYGVVAITKAEGSGLLQIVGASVIVGLLLVPASSRRWFHDLPAEK